MAMKHLQVKSIGTVQRCQVRGCRGDGLWKPVVRVKYGEKEASAEINLRVCTLHRKSLGDEYFVSLVFRPIANNIRDMGLEPPLEKDATVRWEKWHAGIIVIDDN